MLKNVFDSYVAGPWKMVAGKLVPTSIDVYIAMEYADGGDLFNLKGKPFLLFLTWTAESLGLVL